MEVVLMEVRGIVDAYLSLKMSKRNYDSYAENEFRHILESVTDPTSGKFLQPGIMLYDDSLKSLYEYCIDQLNIIAKWGAGIGVNSYIDTGHDSILRFIDFSIRIKGLHRGAMDDFDSHVMRMNNRIVRSSTRSGNAYKCLENSTWYDDKIISFEKVMHEVDDLNIDKLFPRKLIKDNGLVYCRTDNGYIREDYLDSPDAQRGLYQLSIPMDCICKINLYDMRHIYKRRNEYTHANPELAEMIESLADQIEEALPGNLGKLVRYDYCSDGELHHIMDIQKTYVFRKKESSINKSDSVKFDGIGDGCD